MPSSRTLALIALCVLLAACGDAVDLGPLPEIRGAPIDGTGDAHHDGHGDAHDVVADAHDEDHGDRDHDETRDDGEHDDTRHDDVTSTGVAAHDALAAADHDVDEHGGDDEAQHDGAPQDDDGAPPYVLPPYDGPTDVAFADLISAEPAAADDASADAASDDDASSDGTDTDTADTADAARSADAGSPLALDAGPDADGGAALTGNDDASEVVVFEDAADVAALIADVLGDATINDDATVSDDAPAADDVADAGGVVTPPPPPPPAEDGPRPFPFGPGDLAVSLSWDDLDVPDDHIPLPWPVDGVEPDPVRYTDALEARHGTLVAVEGFVIPTVDWGKQLRRFAISVDPPGCCFGQASALDRWIEVELIDEADPLEYSYWAVARVEGELIVAEHRNPYGYIESMYQLRARKAVIVD